MDMIGELKIGEWLTIHQIRQFLPPIFAHTWYIINTQRNCYASCATIRIKLRFVLN